MTAPVTVCSACGAEYSAREWEALPFVDTADRTGETLEIRECTCGSRLGIEVAKVLRSSRPRITVPSPAPTAGARRDAAALALHLARTRVDDMVVHYAKRTGLDPHARAIVQIMACFSPVLTAIENLVPEAPAT